MYTWYKVIKMGFGICLKMGKKFFVTAAGFEINKKSKTSFSWGKKRIYHHGQPSFRPGIGFQSWKEQIARRWSWRYWLRTPQESRFDRLQKHHCGKSQTFLFMFSFFQLILILAGPWHDWCDQLESSISVPTPTCWNVQMQSGQGIRTPVRSGRQYRSYSR